MASKSARASSVMRYWGMRLGRWTVREALASALLDLVAELGQHVVRVFPVCTLVELGKTALNLLAQGGVLVVAYLEEPQRLADDFAGRLIQAARHFFLDEFFEFRRQRNVHRKSPRMV